MEKRRQVLSILLLAVFLPAFLVSSLHYHGEHRDSVSCTACVQHLPHAGHIGSYDGGLQDCVLCHFLGLLYVPMLSLALVLPLRKALSACVRYRRAFVSAALQTAQSRAPPVFSV